MVQIVIGEMRFTLYPQGGFQQETKVQGVGWALDDESDSRQTIKDLDRVQAMISNAKHNLYCLCR